MNQYHLKGGSWDFRFCDSGYFFYQIFGFCAEKIRFFGFGVSICFSFVGHLVSSFRKRYQRFFRCDLCC